MSPFSTLANYLFVIFIAQFMGGVGVYKLVRRLDGNKINSLISSIFFLLLPFSYLILNFQNGLHHIAFGLFPWILVLFLNFVSKPGVKNAILLSILISFALLINISILLPVLVGIIALIIGFKIKKQKIEKISIHIILIILFALLISTLWYGSDYWLLIFSGPSFGGVPLIKLIQSIFHFLLQLLPILLAIFVIKWRHSKPSKILLFGTLFFSSFFFLTIVRFISDPDFVIDWIGFLIELQFGGAIILAGLTEEIKIEGLKLNTLIKNFRFLLLFIIISILFISGWSATIMGDTFNPDSAYKN